MNKSIERISAVMLAFMTLLSSIFVVPANAATGDKVTISFNYCYDTNGNLIKYQQTTVNDGYTVGSAGDDLLITYVDGREAYCIQPGHSLFAGDQLTEGSSSAWNSLGTAKQNTINLALLCGKPGSGSALPGNADEKWAATQLIVWEIVSGCRETSGSYNCTNTKYINGITAGGANSGVKSAYNQIVSNMQTMKKIPSFAADSTGSSKTYEMNASGGSYSLTLTDNNSVLGRFDFKSTGGVNVSISGNKLTLTAKSPINNAVVLSASKSVSGASASLIAYGDSGLQDVVSGASGINVNAYFKVKATPGSLKLVKTSEDGKVSGIEFTVKGTNYNKTVKTNSKGEFTLSALVPGTYTVTEKEDSRYEKQSPKTVKVESGKTASVSFKNTLRTGGLRIIKTSDDGIVANIEFTVKGTNYNKTAKSNSKGEILLSDLIPGKYTVTEKVDARYEAQAPKTVTVEEDKTATVKFNNTLRKGGLQIIKTSDDGIVADIEFTVTGKDYSKTAKSDKNGEILLPDLVPGLYKVTENPDPRYEAQEPKMVMVEADKTSTVRFKNVLRTGGLRIIKTSDDGVVADIEFTVTGKDYNKTAKSDESGEILLRDLTPGTYTVTEKVDERYEAQAPKTVTVEADKTATVKFKNTLRTGGLKITKTSDDGIVADIEFTVTGKNYIKTAKSDKNGEIHLADLIPGKYTVTEKVDARYEAQAPQTVTVEADKTATVKFKNTLRKGGLQIIKTSDDGIVADIEFTVTGKDYSKTAKSDNNGEIHLADLIPGIYTVTEKVDVRYEAQAPKTVTVEADKTAIVKFKNTLRKGGLKIIKTSDDGIVADIEFTVTGKNYSKTIKSDKNGEITLPDLIPGTYTVTEKVDERYEVQSPKAVIVEADKTAVVKFKNILRTGDLKIIKTSDDGIVADIEFTITGKDYNKTAKSDESGEILLRDLIPGTYTVTEKVDDRYEAQSPKTVTVEADKTAVVKFKNTLRTGDLKIIKTSDDGIVADIEFTITGKNYSKTAKSDKNGEIILPDLIPGTYTVTEKADERYEAQAPKTVTVEADKTATVKFKNTLKKWSVKIVKKDSETGKVIPYAGAEFQLYYPNGKLVSMNGSDVFTTDDNGSITTPEPLTYGKKYYLVEIKAPYGYVLDSTPVYFDVTDESTTEEKGVMLIKTEKSNPPQTGRITVEKFGEIFVDVITPDDPPVIPTPSEEFVEADMIMMAKAVFEPTENDPINAGPEFVPTDSEAPKTYQPVYSVTGLAGAVFEVYAAEDITTPDGTVRVKNDTLVAALTTDESGKATSKQLYLGKYRIVETKAPYGMLLNGKPKTVELTYAGQNLKITTVAAEFHNDRQKVKIDLQKLMGIDERFKLGINDEILNVTFGLFADEDIIAASGRSIPKDGLIEIIGCDENGFAEFTTDLPFGSYYVQELTTDEHYILSDTKYPILFGYAGQDIDTVYIKANNGEPIINDLKYGAVKGLKIDRETEKTIKGAVFGLFGNDETVFSEDTAILLAGSDENGIFTFENVPYGEYLVHEIKPADGYIPNQNNYPVTIKENEEVIEITAVNDRYPEIRTTAMIEGKKEVGATDMFTLEDTVEYKHLIPGKEYTIEGILMDKATKAPFLSDGKEVTSEAVFTPEQANGTITVSFLINAALITEETDIVVFETLYADGNKLAVHADIEDRDQTVRIKLPKIRTKANIEGKKEITTDKPVIITDIVSFDDLTIGKEYKLVGVLMDKATGKPYAVDGKEITAEVVFTAEKESGEIEVEFTFNSGVITKDTELVVFETLYRGDNEIAVHADINDKDQTVIIRPVPAVPSVPVIPPVTVSVPKTCDDTSLSLWLSIGAVALGAVISFLIVRFRRKDEDDDE